MYPSTLGLLLFVLLLAPGSVFAHDTDDVGERLAKLGPAADFTLTNQDGDSLSLHDLRGNVVAVTFIYTSCADVCPMLTAKLVGIQQQLSSAFGSDVFFLSVTVDPEHDTPAVLKRYAAALGCDPSGWAYLTGTADAIRQTAWNYGVYHEKQADGDVDHNLLTSIIDRSGTLRVQYLGERFDSSEFLHDLRDLIAEDSTQ